MTTTRSRSGAPLHFPGAYILDSVGVLKAPSPEALAAIADDVAPRGLPEFVRGLMKSACRRRHNPRWAEMNRARAELARLCLDRMLGHELRHVEAEEAAKAGDGDPRDLVAEAFHTFGEDAARALADRLGVALADCAEAIERMRRRPH